MFYSFFVTLLIIGLIISFYIYINGILVKNAFTGMDQSVKRVSAQLDSLFENMDNASNLILLNKDLQYILLDSIDFNLPGTNYFDYNPGQKNKVYDILLSIIGVKNAPRRTCLFNGMQNYVSYSTLGENYNTSYLRSMDIVSLENKIKSSKNGAVILPPHQDNWTTESNAPMVVSLIRQLLFTWGSSNLLGYIEIQQPYSIIRSICTSSVEEHSRIIVRNEEGVLIYPLTPAKQEDADFYFREYKGPESPGTFIVKNPQSGTEELVYATSSPITGWTILQILPKKDFMAPVYKMQKILIFAGITLILITLIIIYLVTDSLTTPIKQLRQSLKNVSLQTPSLDIDFKGSNNEIILLNSAFGKTLQRLNESMNQTIQARSREVEAHFLALQAQMDPHFLYNSLMGISAAGQEYDNQKVVDMCSLLSRMLRYTASYNTAIVNLSGEIDHARNYLHMLKFRYEDKFTYEFLIDRQLEDIKVPKLLLQPLIENSFSHGFSNIRPPYFIRITGTVSDNSWTIGVHDNGSGFHPAALEKIDTCIKKYDESLRDNTYKDDLEVGGMAIFNIYVRLKILYKENVVFSITNDSGGATVTVGGKII